MQQMQQKVLADMIFKNHVRRHLFYKKPPEVAYAASGV